MGPLAYPFVIGSCAAHSHGSKVTDAGSSSVCFLSREENVAPFEKKNPKD
jgi:hypothetical protein